MMGRLFFGLALVLYFGCDKTDDALPLIPDATGRYDFNDGLQGWEAGVSDFPSISVLLATASLSQSCSICRTSAKLGTAIMIL